MSKITVTYKTGDTFILNNRVICLTNQKSPQGYPIFLDFKGFKTEEYEDENFVTYPNHDFKCVQYIGHFFNCQNGVVSPKLVEKIREQGFVNLEDIDQDLPFARQLFGIKIANMIYS